MDQGTPGSIVFEALTLFMLIGVNAYFAVMEISVVGSRRSRIDQMAADGHAGARVVQGWIKNDSSQSRFIASSQLGVTFASLALGIVGERLVDSLIAALLEDGGAKLTPALRAGLPVLLSIFLVSSLHLVLGEQVPKVAALRAPERVAVALALPMRLFSRVFSPMINLLNGATRLVLRLFGLRGSDEDARVYTVEELRQIVRESEQSGVLDEDEREIIDAVFDIRGLLVRQVMVPRTEMHMVAAGARLDEIVRETIETPYTKFPVYDRDPDDIIGVLYVKDLVKALAHPKDEITARSLATGTLFVPETMHVVRLMELFRESGKHIAIIHDEFGGTEGMATLDDILGQLIGEVPDRFEYDQGEYHDVICNNDDFCVVDGLMLIEEFNELFGVRLHDENYNTIGGYVMGRLGRVPKVGDTVQAQGLRLSVEAMDALRIDQIGVYGRAPALEPDGS